MTAPSYADATWKSANARSERVNVHGAQYVGFITPASLVGTAFTFEMTPSFGSPVWVPVKDSSGAAISFTVAASGYYGFNANQIEAFRGVQNLRIVSNASEADNTLVKMATREVA